MKRLNFVQGSRDWLDWRLDGVGGSEIAVIKEASDDNTPHGLWLVKTKRKEGWAGNFITDHGKETENKARKLYQLLYMEDMEPAEGEHPKYPICRASFDGISADGKTILEIKCPVGQETITLAKAGELPLKYMMQVQYQLGVSGADKCDFFVYHAASNEYAKVEVFPDVKMQGELFAAAMDFWTRYVITDIAPPLCDRDVKEVNDHQIVLLCELIKSLDPKKDKKKVDSLKSDAVALAGHPKMLCGDVQISTVLRNGKFSYHKLTIKKPQQASVS